MWTVTASADPNHTNRKRITAIFKVEGERLPRRVVKRDNLTDEEVDTFDPEFSFQLGLAADNVKARALRSRKAA